MDLPLDGLGDERVRANGHRVLDHDAGMVDESGDLELDLGLAVLDPRPPLRLRADVQRPRSHRQRLAGLRPAGREPWSRRTQEAQGDKGGGGKGGGAERGRGKGGGSEGGGAMAWGIGSVATSELGAVPLNGWPGIFTCSDSCAEVSWPNS